MKDYCFVCAFLNCILRTLSSFYIETGANNKEKVEKYFKLGFCSKEKKPLRFIHESEIFI